MSQVRHTQKRSETTESPEPNIEFLSVWELGTLCDKNPTQSG